MIPSHHPYVGYCGAEGMAVVILLLGLICRRVLGTFGHFEGGQHVLHNHMRRSQCAIRRKPQMAVRTVQGHKQNRNYGLTRMALKLGAYFSGFAFPIAVAVLRIFELVSRLC
jgi:hypothetical protein